MEQFLMKPKIDFAFKEIMMDGKARIGFLAAVLHLDPEDIKEARILNPYLRKIHEDDKLGILDVRILMNNDPSSMPLRCTPTRLSRDRNMTYSRNASASASWTLRFSKKRLASIPASISGRIPAGSCILTRWNSM